MTWSEKVMFISVDRYRRPKHIYGVFIALAGHYKSFAEKTAGDLSWPEMTLATLGGVTDRNIPVHRVNSTFNKMFESDSNGFVQKRLLSIFALWLIIMERLQN